MWKNVPHYRSKLGMHLSIYIGGNVNVKNIEVLNMFFFSIFEITHTGEELRESPECGKYFL